MASSRIFLLDDLIEKLGECSNSGKESSGRSFCEKIWVHRQGSDVFFCKMMTPHVQKVVLKAWVIQGGVCLNVKLGSHLCRVREVNFFSQSVGLARERGERAFFCVVSEQE